MLGRLREAGLGEDASPTCSECSLGTQRLPVISPHRTTANRRYMDLLWLTGFAGLRFLPAGRLYRPHPSAKMNHLCYLLTGLHAGCAADSPLVVLRKRRAPKRSRVLALIAPGETLVSHCFATPPRHDSQ